MARRSALSSRPLDVDALDMQVVVALHATIIVRVLARHRIPAHWNAAQLSGCVPTICTHAASQAVDVERESF
jgi:hypothetical protein